MIKVTKYLTIMVLAAGLSACATSGDVDKKIADMQAATNKKIDSVEGQIEDLQQK